MQKQDPGRRVAWGLTVDWGLPELASANSIAQVAGNVKVPEGNSPETVGQVFAEEVYACSPSQIEPN